MSMNYIVTTEDDLTGKIIKFTRFYELADAEYIAQKYTEINQTSYVTKLETMYGPSIREIKNES